MGEIFKHGAATLSLIILLAGCAATPVSEATPSQDFNSQESASAVVAFDGELEDIELPNLDENCAATKKQILKIDLEEYSTVLSEFKNDSDPTDWTYLKNLTWEQMVEGPSLVAARKILSESPVPGAKNMEATSRNQFHLFVDIVLKHTLIDCGLKTAYLERLELLKEGRMVVQRDISGILGSNPPLETGESGRPWNSYSEEIDWRWGSECDRGFGSCKVVEVKTSIPCSSIYVEANFISGGIITDSAIDSLQNVRANQTSSFELVTAESADSISLTDISCFR